MADIKIKATERTEFGKGAARRARRDGLTPAVVYGHGTDPLHLLLDAQQLFLALRTANALFELEIEGQKKPVLALPKQIQRDPIMPVIEHVDFLIVKAGEKVSVEIPVVLTGEPARDTLTNHDLVTLPVLAPATDIPNEVEVSIEGLEIGDSVLVSQITLPNGVEADIDPETLVVSIVAPVVEDLPEPETDEEGEESEEGAEGEESEEDSE